MERKTIGIPYAEAGMLSSELEELLDQMVDAWQNNPVEDVDEFYQAWAVMMLKSLKITDRYFVTCPECDKKLYGSGRTEDEITKGAGVRYARHYAWAHTKERLGSNLSAVVIEDANFTTKPCIRCGKVTQLKLDATKVVRYRAGEHVQNVWPDKSDDEREMLITGTHPACWDQMFGDDHEE